MEKFKKYINILDKILGALFIAFMVFAIVMSVFAVVGFIGIPGVIIGELDSKLVLGVMEIEISDSLEIDADKVNSVLAISAILAAVQFAIGCVMLKLLQKLIAPMKEGEIFHPDVATNIKRLAIYVLAGGFITEIIGFAGEAVSLSVFDTSSLFNAETVASHSVSFELNGNFVVYSAIIYLLSFVFKYGAELQAQVDETL